MRVENPRTRTPYLSHLVALETGETLMRGAAGHQIIGYKHAAATKAPSPRRDGAQH